MTTSARNGSAGPAARGGGIKTQINLPWAKAIEIAMNSLKIRFWRSMITAAGIFLGIAFLCFSGIPLLIQTRNHALGHDQNTYRQIWLVIMALLVCTVGITNAMLMSVSERFREIGTMKCLGALDGLVLRLFLIEAVFMGAISSVAGWVLGYLSALLVHAVQGLHDITISVTLLSLAYSLVTGIVLTFVAAMLPALRASQMPPAAALRTEV
ncbi:MAG: FtsX-like permease family protein [Pseudomonadota bacterium]|nr:FtsX-like permease family protein [Pseudomonadota bacterium]